MATQKQVAPRTRRKAVSPTGHVIAMTARESAEFSTLIAQYNDEFAPETLEERYLVSRLVRSEWLCRRYYRLEAAVWKAHRLPEADAPPGDGRDGKAIAAIYRRAANDLDQVSRGLESTQNNYLVALKRLLAIRARRASARKKQSLAQGAALFLAPKRG